MVRDFQPCSFHPHNHDACAHTLLAFLNDLGQIVIAMRFSHELAAKAVQVVLCVVHTTLTSQVICTNRFKHGTNSMWELSRLFHHHHHNIVSVSLQQGLPGCPTNTKWRVHGHMHCVSEGQVCGESGYEELFRVLERQVCRLAGIYVVYILWNIWYRRNRPWPGVIRCSCSYFKCFVLVQ